MGASAASTAALIDAEWRRTLFSRPLERSAEHGGELAGYGVTDVAGAVEKDLRRTAGAERRAGGSRAVRAGDRCLAAGAGPLGFFRVGSRGRGDSSRATEALPTDGPGPG